MSNVWARKSIDVLQRETSGAADAAAAGGGSGTLRRSLSLLSVVGLGVGACIGAGIFVLTGQAAAEYAGPAIILSFVLAGAICVFAGFCYSEMGRLLPRFGERLHPTPSPPWARSWLG